jgi:hypothetical protein
MAENNKRYNLASLIILLTGVMYISVQAQKKNAPLRANFSGQWQSKEAISIGGNIFCSYDAGDRMASKSMKIVERGDFITIENPASNNASVKSLEKMVFDGKTRQISHGQGNRKTFSVKLSNGGQTMTIRSIAYFITSTPYKVNVKQQAYTDVTEVWNLSKDGKSIAVLAKAKSNIWDEERSWKTVFDRID